jgi:CheY-like chemotaxis protein
MTRKILLISNDKDLIGFINIATLTLTKLNHQITITEDKNDGYIDWMIVDMDTDKDSNFEFIMNSRDSGQNKNVKIVSVLSSVNDGIKERLFKSGCDSVMTKKEFHAVANNILIF